MDTWFANKYFNSNLNIPGFVLQPIINTYVDWYHRMGVWRGHPNGCPTPTGTFIADRSTELMTVHYDQPLTLFENFLGPSMKYSMGLWENGAHDLEQAQSDMMEDVCRKAGIQDGDSILDLGCGFGSFAAHALKALPQARVTGLTLSRVQADYIARRQQEPDHPLNTDRFRLVEADFNTVNLKETYDRIVSIGVFEHFADLSGALEKVRGLMNLNGTCLLHFIVYFKPLDRMDILNSDSGFISRYIFPGGRIWFEGELFNHQNHMKIDNAWFLNGANYRKTLKCWLANLWDNMEQIRLLEVGNPQTIKMWDFYFRACIGVFSAHRGGFYGNGQYLLHPA